MGKNSSITIYVPTFVYVDRFDDKVFTDYELAKEWLTSKIEKMTPSELSEVILAAIDTLRVKGTDDPETAYNTVIENNYNDEYIVAQDAFYNCRDYDN